MSGYRFTVIGKPIPKGSMNVGVSRQGRAYAYDQQGDDLKSYAQAIAHECQRARDRTIKECLRCGVRVKIAFYRSRNKGDFGSGRNAGLLKESAPYRPITKPDIDKLARAALDAMTGIAFLDDSQVVELALTKMYAEDNSPPRTVILVEPLPEHRPAVFPGQMALTAA